MATFRTPRGYSVNRPAYQELSAGVRPEASTVPMEAWTGLLPVRVDEIHHDPIVLDAGTIVGIASGGNAAGKLFPAHSVTGSSVLSGTAHADGASWGLPTSNVTETATSLTAGPVLPLGVVYQPIYSFMLQQQFVNYKRNENVGIVTDYLIQVPCITAEEHNILPGELVTCSMQGVGVGGTYGSVAATTTPMGRYQAWDGTLAAQPYLVGRCFSKLNLGTDGGGAVGTKLSADTGFTISTAAAAEFKGLAKVQTVPGLGLAGSGTSGIPAWLQAAESDGTDYKALTILIRL
jgi:hypothetical protein